MVDAFEQLQVGFQVVDKGTVEHVPADLRQARRLPRLLPGCRPGLTGIAADPNDQHATGAQVQGRADRRRLAQRPVAEILAVDLDRRKDQRNRRTKVYSYLLDLLTSLGIKDARVVKAPDIEGSVCFNISGSNDYFVILNILEALRSDGKMQKVTELNLSAAADGRTSYSLTVAVSLKPENASQTNGEAPKGEGSVSQ